MPAEITPLTPADNDEAGRILFEAFKDIADKHGFPPEFQSVHRARRAIAFLGSIEQSATFASRAPWLQGLTVMATLDEVAGIGPVAVDIGSQGLGIGRSLMVAALDEAERRGHTKVRLIQDAFNVTSLSLYASLGFQVVEPMVTVRSPAIVEPIAGLKQAGAGDAASLGALYQRLTSIQRDAEIEMLLERAGGLLIERDGEIRGFVLGFSPDAITFGAAEDNATLLDLAGAWAAGAAPAAQWNLPTRHPGLLEDAIKAGARVIKPGNLMVLGPYEPPSAPHMISYWY
ncbi:MAG: GNAT family N-acetyltransferase [Dehalococcoidia bacterium]